VCAAAGAWDEAGRRAARQAICAGRSRELRSASLPHTGAVLLIKADTRHEGAFSLTGLQCIDKGENG
jgi:hypothetical protein